MTKREQKIIDGIINRFEASQLGYSYNFFKSVIVKVTYLGYETRIRLDKVTGLYWGRMDNEDTSTVLIGKSVNSIIKSFIKSVNRIEKAKKA